MADGQPDPSKASSTFPDPPHFWQDFTPEKISRIDRLRKDYAAQHGIDISAVIRLAEASPELEHLQPPPEPSDGTWKVFGESQTLKDELQTLEAGGIERLVPADSDHDGRHMDRAFELTRLAKSLLLNFLECVGTMGINPQQGSEKVQDLRTLLLNFHHVLNEYRPHQAREQLITLMADQLDRKRAETAAIRSVIDRAKHVLEGLGSLEVLEARKDDTGLASRARTSSTHVMNGESSQDHQQLDRDNAAWATMLTEFP